MSARRREWRPEPNDRYGWPPPSVYVEEGGSMLAALGRGGSDDAYGMDFGYLEDCDDPDA